MTGWLQNQAGALFGNAAEASAPAAEAAVKANAPAIEQAGESFGKGAARGAREGGSDPSQLAKLGLLLAAGGALLGAGVVLAARVVRGR